MPTPLEALTEQDLELIDFYRGAYAPSSDGDCSNSFCDVKYLLREWDYAKSQHLFQMFGERLTLSREIEYVKSQDELDAEMGDLTSTWGRKERSGRVFAKAYWEWVDNHTPMAIYEPLCQLFNCTSLTNNRFEGDSFEIPLREEGKTLKIAKGCKVSKALGKIASIFNLDGFEDFRICHSQVLNQKTLKGTLTLSIHPLDYMTMSDNECGWESCMNWRSEGGYRQGTVEMMNSPTVIVAYLTAEDPMYLGRNYRTDEKYYWNNKKWRQLIICDPRCLLSVKGYPYQNDDLTQEILNWLRELSNGKYEEPIKYNYNDDRLKINYNDEEREYIVCVEDNGYMYNDMGSISHHWLSLNKNLTEEDINFFEYSPYGRLFPVYSGKNECMICGTRDTDFDDESCLACSDCQDIKRCDCCGDRIYDGYWIDGYYLCEYCYGEKTAECDICGGIHHEDQMLRILIVPRFTEEEHKLHLMNYDFNYGLSGYQKDFKEVCYQRMPGYLDSIEICDNDDCIDRWVEKYLKPGERPHSRTFAWEYGNFVYYDQLNDDGKRMYCGGQMSEESFKKVFAQSGIVPQPSQYKNLI